MGRHAAGDDATVHPLVADALARRSGAGGAAHGEERAGRSGSTGWPEPPPGGGGAVGWPDDIRPDEADEPQETADGAADEAATPSVPQPRRGWRRLFGPVPAA